MRWREYHFNTPMDTYFQDYSMQPPTQELVVRDLHDNTWTFRHIYRGIIILHASTLSLEKVRFCSFSSFSIPAYLGQPKRHLLTTGWSMFVGAKRLRAGDAVLFIRYSTISLYQPAHSF